MANKSFFGQSIIESEIDIKDENLFTTTTEPTKIETSDSSDIEVVAICQRSDFGVRKKISSRPFFRIGRHNNSLNSESNSSNSLVKEEIVISDGSDYSDDDGQNNESSNSILSKRKKENESFSSITLNCPRCNKTEKVFRTAIKSNCKECNVNMYYICDKCNYKYDNMLALYRHGKLQCHDIGLEKRVKPNVSKMLLMKCNNCDIAKKINNKRSLGLCSECRKRMCYECVVCAKNYTTYSGSYGHIQCYCQPKRRNYFCDDCTYSCSIRKTMIRHMKQNHIQHYQTSRIRDFNYSCLKCNKVLKDSKEMRTHETLCGSFSYQCKYCTYETKSCIVLKKHLMTLHSEKVEVDGLDNVLKIVALNNLPKDDTPENTTIDNSNEKTSSPDIQRLWYCPKCNRTDQLVKNRSSCPTCNTSYMFQCASCYKKFVTLNSLKRHNQRLHETFKFHCKTCGKGFAYVGIMNEHLKICGQAQRYECQICEFKTRYRKSLGAHIYKLHNDNRRVFKCGTCGVEYKTNRAIKKHLKIGCKM